jgi:hypothetical protein
MFKNEAPSTLHAMRLPELKACRINSAIRLGGVPEVTGVSGTSSCFVGPEEYATLGQNSDHGRQELVRG